MEKKDPDCKIGSVSGLISDEVFGREISMCKKLHREKKGKCQWGKCESCGAIPLLYKLHGGELLERPEEIEAAKREIFDS